MDTHERGRPDELGAGCPTSRASPLPASAAGRHTRADAPVRAGTSGPDEATTAAPAPPAPETSTRATVEPSDPTTDPLPVSPGPLAAATWDPDPEASGDGRPDRTRSSPDGPAPAGWVGAFTPFEVGAPGRAATAPSFPDAHNWDVRDTVVDGALLRGGAGTPPVDLRAASARGRQHRYDGIVRQDAYAFRCDGRHVVAAVTDGVSSGRLSHVASNVVSQQGCEFVLRMLERTPPADLDWHTVLDGLAKQVIGAGKRRLGESVSRQEVAQQMATTALFVVLEMRPDRDGSHAVHGVAHGDSSAWILRAGQDAWQPQQPVKNTGATIASSATQALPYLSTEATPPVLSTVLWPGDVLMIASDGIGDPLGDGGGVVGAFLADVWRDPPEPLAFAAQVDFARRTHDDDRTALALWPGRAT